MEEKMTDFVQIRDIKIGKGIPKICVPIVGRTTEEIFAAARSFHGIAPDVVEWRADWFEGIRDFEGTRQVLAKLRSILGNTPLLFTFRSQREGGNLAIEPDAYVTLNQKVIGTGLADLVDVEIFTGDAYASSIIQAAHRTDVKVIGSYHDFHKTPSKEEIVTRLKKMWELGADIPKIAVMPQTKKDVLILLAATEEVTSEYHRPVITMSMAQTGMISRLCGEVFGSALTFGAVGQTSAPGQISAAELREILTLIHKNLELSVNADF